MIGYGNDMYVPSYEGDAWSWGGQPWGSGYEQVQYDCSGTWGDYQQQTSWQAPEATGPKVGAELLTELRLAELKRLIDRDARALKASTEVLDIESTDSANSADCTTRAPDSNEDTPTKDDTASSAPSAPQESKVPHFPCEEGEDTEDLAPTRTKPSSRAKRLGDDEADLGATTSISRPSAAPPPPGLETLDEECYVAIADFSPESRNYGELPVCVGEEIFISGVPVDGWIFGVKRDHGEIIDEGWLPASALPIPLPRRLEEDTAQRARQHGSQSSGGVSRRGGRNQQQTATVGAGGSRKVGDSSHQQQRGMSAQHWWKGGRSDHEKGSGKGDDQAWHQHGNWWSRQRHLRNDGKDPDSHSSNAHGGGSRKGLPRPAPPPPPAASSDEEQEVRQSSRKGRGARGSRGSRVNSSAVGSQPDVERRTEKKCDTEPRVERPTRERRALTTMLDRLNKPLIAPKAPPTEPVS